MKSQADLKRAQRQREAAQEVKDELHRQESLQQQYEQLKKSQVAKESLLRENLEQIRKDSIQAKKERQERKLREDSQDREIEQLQKNTIEARKFEASMKKKVCSQSESDPRSPNEGCPQDSDADRPREEGLEEDHRQGVSFPLLSSSSGNNQYSGPYEPNCLINTLSLIRLGFRTMKTARGLRRPGNGVLWAGAYLRRIGIEDEVFLGHNIANERERSLPDHSSKLGGKGRLFMVYPTTNSRL